MKYNQPYGSTDPNAPYVDRNTPGAVAGSRVPAAAIEHPQREIMAVIAAAGIAPDPADLTQLLQAIQKIIDAATGGAGDANYVLMTQARVRLPIFPEVINSDGKLAVISPSTGVLRIMPGYDFLHRGIFNVTTVQQDFPTSPSKTYHLRWNPTDGYVLRDLASGIYNAAGLNEANPAFDTTYDDMLIAKVVTSASNVASITTLKNKSSLAIDTLINGNVVGSDTGNAYADIEQIYDWARSPSHFAFDIAFVFAGNGIQRFGVHPKGATSWTVPTAYDINRYRISQRCAMDEMIFLTMHFSAGA